MNRQTHSWEPPGGGLAFRLHPRPTLIPLDVFCVLHGLKLKRGFELVDDFSVWPAFNLSTSLGGRRKIHLWRGCVETYDPNREMPRGELAAIIAAALPPLEKPPVSAPTVRGCELTFRFCCSHNRLQDLIRAGELREFGRHHRVGGTYRITYASAVNFLESRVVGKRGKAETEEEGENEEKAAGEAPVAARNSEVERSTKP